MTRLSMPVKGCLIVFGLGVFLVAFLTAIADLLQTNPPVVSEPAWDSPQTLALAKRACFDCHSNQTSYPWYDKLPVSSWLVDLDIFRGRRALNFSNWQSGNTRRERGVDRVIQDGSMPPTSYILLHPNANLTDQEKQQLIQGLQNSLK